MGTVIELPLSGRRPNASHRPRRRAPAGPWGLGTGAAAAALTSVFVSADPVAAPWTKLLAPLAFGAAVGVGTWLLLSQSP